MIAGLRVVGVGCESEPAGVLDGSEYEVADELDRRGDRRWLIAAEDLVGEQAKALLVQVVGSDRVLDAEAVDVEQVDAHRRAAAVATPAGDERGDQPADGFVSMLVVPVGVPVDLRADV